MADSDSIKLCECGCGKPAPIAKYTQRKYGWVKGQPSRFVRGHARATHWHSKPRSPTYRSWTSMSERCSNKNATNYYLYGGAGVSVCERWRDFANFLTDMGERPPGTSLDRHPNRAGNYEPGNARWASSLQQGRNKSVNVFVEHGGRTLCLSAWAEVLGIQPITIQKRYKLGDRPPRLFRPVETKYRIKDGRP